MKEIQTIATAQNFSAINIGRLNQLGEYELHLGANVVIPGKVFGGAALHATGGDFSFQVFPAGMETGFLHTHKHHEELYFFLNGKGEFQVDGQVSLKKAAWYAWLPQANGRCATTVRNRS